jgi:hypothetical protein
MMGLIVRGGREFLIDWASKSFSSLYTSFNLPLCVVSFYSALVSLYAVTISTLLFCSAQLLPILAISDSPDSIIGPTIGY